MAFPEKTVSNPASGQSIRFLQTSAMTGGRLLEMESIYTKNSDEPASHYHPFQSEEFGVVSGILTVRINGMVRNIGEGETLHIPAGQAHTMWNASGGRTVVNWKVYPAMNTEHFLETVFGLAADGKTNAAGMPAFLQTVITAFHFSRVFRLAKPPYFMLRILMLFLVPLAFLAGYRAVYRKHSD
ncbi:MAG: cupin domain-containing protein [Mucilaginibacter polytrichastri]|nr:cupin domain-containing protein [Mucilaginibacter polytrichastri]